MRAVEYLPGNGMDEGLFAAVNLSHLYRLAKVEPISLREVPQANFWGSTYVNERG